MIQATDGRVLITEDNSLGILLLRDSRNDQTLMVIFCNKREGVKQARQCARATTNSPEHFKEVFSWAKAQIRALEIKDTNPKCLGPESGPGHTRDELVESALIKAGLEPAWHKVFSCEPGVEFTIGA
jgi:hypothetical protein